MKNGKQSKYRGILVLIIILFSLAGLLLLSSCEKEEPLWKLPPPGNEETDQVAMGENYDDCIFYKLSTKAQTTRLLNTWHLAFESAPNGWHIRMNGGRAMQLYNTGSTNFSENFSASASSNWDWDTPDGNAGSTAIGRWFINAETFESKREVYIIDMGLNAPSTYKKLQILSGTDTSYTIRYANLDNAEERTLQIIKSPVNTYTYFDLTANTLVDFEPPAYSYDLLFTRYRYIFFEDGQITPYLVNGALLNPVNTLAARVTTTTNFDSLTYEMVKDIPLSAKTDTIGYAWKYYDFGTSSYKLVSNLYLVKDAEGNLWKLQFYDFYSDQGTKGFPKFRFQRL